MFFKKYLFFISLLVFLSFAFFARAATGDGDLIKLFGDYKVYIVKIVGNKKYIRWLFSEAVAGSYNHLNLTDVKEVDELEFSQYEETALIRKAGDYKVYSVGNIKAGKSAVKYWVKDEKDYPDFDPDAVYVVNSKEFGIYAQGENYDAKKAGRISKFQDASKSLKQAVFGVGGRFMTRLISWPDKKVETDKVEFKFSGEDLARPNEKVQFETFLVGYDNEWQSAFSGSRLVTLNSGDKYYDFLVRAKSKDGSVDPNPKKYSFRAALSPFYKKVSISGGKITSGNYQQEYIELKSKTNKEDSPINVSGWKLSNYKGDIIIPLAVKKLYLQYNADTKEDIYFSESGESLKIFTDRSPLALNFRLNKCAGYLSNSYGFSYDISKNCPRPDWQKVQDVSANCRDYISSLSSCEEPDFNALPIVYDDACKSYLANFNYSKCVMAEQGKDDFLRGYSYNEWRVYLGRSENLWHDKHDTIELRDKSGLIVDKYVY